MNQSKLAVSAGVAMLATYAPAQIPDLTSSLDPGGRSMGSGGALNSTNADTLSSFFNPAGLGYLTRPQFGIAYRNLPQSRTGLTGSFENPFRDTRGGNGDTAVTHVGYALPFARFGGTIAFSYTLGGYIDDLATSPVGSFLQSDSGAFSVANFVERRRARADFYTVAFGRTNSSQTLSYGVGLTYLRQTVEYSQDGVSQPVGGFTSFNLDSAGSGIGVIAGVQYIPPKSPNVSLAASVMTPIDLSGNSETSALYDRVPGRLLLGGATRREGFRGGQDYLVVGGQLEYFYGGRGSIAFDRSDQTGAGVGVEYGYGLGGATLPLRVGYRGLSSGGDDFATRSGLTYGVGYRPRDSRYSIDFNWSRPQGGSNDFAVTATYRF